MVNHDTRYDARRANGGTAADDGDDLYRRGTRAGGVQSEGAGDRSVFDLFARLVDNLSVLFSREVDLAKAEMSEKVSRIGGGLTTAAIGAVLLIPAITILLAAAVIWLDVADVPIRWGTLIVGAVAAVIGIAMMLSGARTARPHNLAPRRTTTQLRRDAAVVKEQVR